MFNSRYHIFERQLLCIRDQLLVIIRNLRYPVPGYLRVSSTQVSGYSGYPGVPGYLYREYPGTCTISGTQVPSEPGYLGYPLGTQEPRVPGYPDTLVLGGRNF